MYHALKHHNAISISKSNNITVLHSVHIIPWKSQAAWRLKIVKLTNTGDITSQNAFFIMSAKLPLNTRNIRNRFSFIQYLALRKGSHLINPILIKICFFSLDNNVYIQIIL